MVERRPTVANPAPDFGTLVRYAAALCTAGAAVGHLSAARDHPAHAHIAVFFVALALAQFAWAATAAFRPTNRLLVIGALGNAAVAALWVLTRTTAIPWIPGLENVEAVAMKDAVVTLFEVIAVASVGLLLAMPATVRTAALSSPDRAFGALMAGVLVLTIPAALGPHGHGDGHGAHGPGSHTDGNLASSHGHGAEGGEVHSHAGRVLSEDHEHVALAGVTGTHAHQASGHPAGQSHLNGDPAHANGGPAHGGVHEGHDDPFAWPPGQATTVRYGPFTLPPASLDSARGWNALLTNVVLADLEPPCRGCTIVAMEPDLVYQDGRRANYDTGAMLHHAVIFDSTRDDPTCARSIGIGGFGLRVFASGNERTGAVFPSGFGLPVQQDAWYSGLFEIMNLTDQPQTVWFSLHVRYRPASDGLEPLVPVWLDLDNCGDSEVPVPEGRSVTTWEWESSITGRVLATGGHVHDGGISITLRNASSGEHMCRSVAGYDNDPAYQGAIDTMSLCSWDRVGRVRAGERLAIDAVYDTPEPISSAMGIMMAFIYETDDLDGGSDAPDWMTSPPEGPPPGHAGHHGH